MKKRTLDLRYVYKEGREWLQKVGVPDADLDAWYLLEYVTGITKAIYLADPNLQIEEGQAEEYFAHIRRRAERVPLQHLTGEQTFMGYSFQVNPHVLIPRQDTEVLVEAALRHVKPNMRILDLCTGSGCILLSVLKKSEALFGKRSPKERPEGVGTDISKEALDIARANAERLQVKAEFLQSDLFAQIEGTYEMIVSNPPYIPTGVIATLQEEVKLHDPMLALDGGEDGLHFYRRIIKESVRHLSYGGRLLFEIGCEQGWAVTKLMEEAGYTSIEIKKDLSGLDRVVSGLYNGK